MKNKKKLFSFNSRNFTKNKKIKSILLYSYMKNNKNKN